MLSTITCVQRESSELIQQRRDDYLRILVAPMDGMWKGVVIDRAAFWEIQDRAQEIFCWIISTCSIQYAITSTIEPLYLSLCLDLQKSIALHSYLFRDHQRRELSFELSNIL